MFNNIKPTRINLRTSSKVRKSPLYIFIIFLLLLIIGGAIFYYTKQRNDATDARLAEITDTIEAISMHVLLPTGEIPTLATVTDPEKLKSQRFFTHALIGDKMLIYTKAQKVILYRPSIDRVIEMSPLDLDVSPTEE